jgi:hypothetical protein
LKVFAKEARITDAVHIVELQDDKLRVEEDAKVTNTMMLGIGQEADDDGVFGLVVGR